MSEKIPQQCEIDFETLSSVHNFDTELNKIDSILKLYRNPYIGNKRKIIKNLCRIIDRDIPCKTVLDLFCGSAVFSMSMKMMGKRVIANDILLSSTANAIAFVENNSVSLSDEDIDFLYSFDEFNETEKERIDSHIVNTKENLFTEFEMNFLSKYWMRAEKLNDDYKFYFAIVNMQNYIMEHCFVGGRLNHGQVVANQQHRLSHVRNKGKQMNFINRGWAKFPIDGEKNIKHIAFNEDSIQLLEKLKNENIDLCYLDPPYGGDQSDYVHMYSFFEEYIRNWSSDRVNDKLKAYTDFSNKSTYADSLSLLLSKLYFIPYWVFSYNDSSWGTIDEIIDLIKKYRNNISVEEVPYSYNYRNVSRNTKETKEYIIVAYR